MSIIRSAELNTTSYWKVKITQNVPVSYTNQNDEKVEYTTSDSHTFNFNNIVEASEFIDTAIAHSPYPLTIAMEMKA